MKKINLSLIIITRNCGLTLKSTLQSAVNLVDEIVLVDDNSTDQTLAIAKQYQAKVYNFKGSFGARKLFALNKASGSWVLNLDSDEQLSKKLASEIKSVVSLPRETRRVKWGSQPSGYYLPYQNYCFNHPLHHGGENYRILRLFKKESVVINDDLIHEHFELKKGRYSGKLRHKILHYSYRSIFQIVRKFTNYAALEARKKTKQGEKTSLKKIFIYPLHMFWARYFKDKG